MFKVHSLSHFFKVLLCTEFTSIIIKLLNEQIILFRLIRNDDLLCYMSTLKE